MLTTWYQLQKKSLWCVLEFDLSVAFERYINVTERNMFKDTIEGRGRRCHVTVSDHSFVADSWRTRLRAS